MESDMEMLARTGRNAVEGVDSVDATNASRKSAEIVAALHPCRLSSLSLYLF
ncbi:hypothetical protein FIBSPDRAFT_878363 [Athelia psychrophila]|uniref:Uncharacterized protein n=1 Tax=Athelia psychrophila TaxID=1759441 RepID=A0A167V400_9AGAM|nr:hypothetical protein FIBSPDRAFT_878363 [Fibularhizoctonia sp. CBS 109695]